MRGLNQKHIFFLFAAIYILVLAQVGWWALVFTRDADLISNLKLQQRSTTPQMVQEIQAEAYRRKLMFLSESLFFAGAACVGLAVLFRALRAERKSREVQRNFIEIVSHESKTPLTGLKFRLESLREKAADPEMARSLTLALEEVRRLSGVLEKTLDLNRSERHALQFESLCLAEVVQSVVHRLEPWLAAKKVQLHLELDPEIYVRGDFASLQNSVQSLLENAVLYNTTEPREVRITVLTRGSRAVLSVADNGPGIAVSDQSRVFDRFYRGQVASSVSGTGLGLYLARVIIEAHRGALRLVHVVRGACFEIELPRTRVV